MEENGQIVSGGASGATLLGIAFVVLKLIGIINWSWWWVLAPFWIPFALAIVLILLAVAYMIIADA